VRPGTQRVALSVVVGMATSGCSLLLDFDALEREQQPAPREDGGQPQADPATAAADAAGVPTLDGGQPPNADGSVPPAIALDASVPGASATNDAGPMSSELDARAPMVLPDGAVVWPPGDAGLDAAAADGCLQSCAVADPCVVSNCVDGECRTTQLENQLVALPFTELVEADALYKSELVAAEGRFFRATYGEWAGKPDIQVKSFTGDTALDEFAYGSALQAGWQPVSPAALVADTRFDHVELYVYAAIRATDADEKAPGQMVRINLRANLTSPAGDEEQPEVVALSDVPNFRSQSTRIGPSAGQLKEQPPFVVWNGCSVEGKGSAAECAQIEVVGGQGGLYLQSGVAALTVGAEGTSFLPESGDVKALSAIKADAPGALWLTSGESGQTFVRHAFSSTPATDELLPTDLVQCDDAVGVGIDSAEFNTKLWRMSFSTRKGSTYSTRSRNLSCADADCSALQAAFPTCQDDALPDVRSQVIRSWHREDDAESRIFNAIAQVRNEGAGSRLVLQVAQVDVDGATGDVTSTEVGELQLAESEVSSGLDFAAVAALGSDRLAVSWLEAPNGEHEKDALQVRTFAVCAP
jgi:hypothetical protein